MEENKPLQVLSLGWGVQSFTLAVMSALGYLEEPDMIIHSETGFESIDTKSFKEKWTPFLESYGLKVTNIKPDISIMSKSNNTPYIPAYSDYRKGGQLVRGCSNLWKVLPIKRTIREEIKKRKMKLLPGTVKLWLGITTDEKRRAKPYSVKYIESRFPLLELGMSRKDCINFLELKNIDIPPKSSCVFCPYRSEDGWRRIKNNKEDWELSLEVDKMIRNSLDDCNLYLHYTLKPLEEIDFYRNEKKGEMNE